MFWKQSNSQLNKDEVLLISEIAKVTEATWYKGICEEGINTNKEVIPLDEGIRELYRGLAKMDSDIINAKKHIALLCLGNRYEATYPWNDIVTNIGGHKLTPLDYACISVADYHTKKFIFIDKDGKNTTDEHKAIGIINSNEELLNEYIDRALETETLIQADYLPNFRKMYEYTNVLDNNTPLISLENNKYLDKVKAKYKDVSEEKIAEYNKEVFNTLGDYKEMLDITKQETEYLDEADKRMDDIISSLEKEY